MKLIILYGNVSNKFNGRNQKLIDGDWTCGYREYAKHAGSIVYMCPQESIRESWEFSFPNGDGLVDWIHQHPDAIVWALKHGGGKEDLLKKIKNFKVYYSCNCKNLVNPLCDISLVDTPDRMVNKKCRLYVKGKDPEFWKPVVKNKDFDYLLMGTRNDKHQSYSINQLTDHVKEKRRILWVGGKKFGGAIKSSHHDIELTPVYGDEEVRNHISRAKIGILYTQHSHEGFPQTFMEMTMCGVPTIYPKSGAPRNKYYFFDENSRLVKKKENIAKTCEDMLRNYSTETSAKCRSIAMENYSIHKSIQRILDLKNG